MSPLAAARSEPSANAASPFSAPQLAERALYRRAVPTDSNGRFQVLTRFDGPQKPLFDKTWRLADIERIASR